jgi:cytosine/adenosine deaminase-related metal-dependent hydrolase
MDDDFTVVDPGVVYVDRNQIVAVLKNAGQPPAGFEAVQPIQTNGTIYPGLIELHNHLSYDILPLWNVPKKFDRRSQWADHPEKTKYITGPMQVLGHTHGYPEAIVRYVEAKCLLAGVTTSQGIKLSGVGIEPFYKGIVRNVDQTSDARLPKANTRIPDVDAKELQGFFDRLQDSNCLLLHLSEGTDERSRDAFQALQFPDETWAINAKLAGIHCAALSQEQFNILEANGGSMIWSPLSNLLLYRQAEHIQYAKSAGALIALGSDWSPSGSKNLLGELKVAHMVSRMYGKLFTPRQLVAMVTTNPAHILKWQNALGSLQKDRFADLIVMAGSQVDPYEQLIAAKESSIILTIIDGIPRVWDGQFKAFFGAGTETVSVGGEVRCLNLHDDQSKLDIQNLSLKTAREKLQAGLRRLSEIALDLETSFAQGGVVDFATISKQTFPTLALDEDMPVNGSQRLLLTGDSIFEQEEMLRYLAGVHYSELLRDVVVELDPLTVIDDPKFFHQLGGQVNLTYEFAQGVADFYDVQLEPPESGRFIRRMKASDRNRFWAARDLPAFKRQSGYLSLADEQHIVKQALVLLELVYVHLPFKRAMHGIDPIQRLKLLQYHLDELQYREKEQTSPQPMPESEFHKEMTSIFTCLRDLHTNYLLPEPYRYKVAFLPFLIEEYFESQDEPHDPKYMVSKILPGIHSETFAEGVEVLYWNGIPIRQAIKLNGELQAGSNPDARLARGLESLTIRPLIRSLPPEEEWVDLRYRGDTGKVHDFRQKWLVISNEELIRAMDAGSGSRLETALGFDLQTDVINQTKKFLYYHEAVVAEQKVQLSGEMTALKVPGLGDLLITSLPEIFRVSPIHNEYGDFGYFRIFSFNVDDENAFITEFLRLARELPQDGLIIDVRNNGGGSIYAAEILLQVLSPRRIKPQPAQFINSPLTLEICRRNAPSGLIQGLDLGQWIHSIQQSIETGAIYSLGFPITPARTLRLIKEKYTGKVILITDSLCYSATDMFAAGFKDNKIGKILGTAGNTGAGGANVWTHALLDRLLRDPNAPLNPLPISPFEPLPYGAGMRVAVRRTLRIGLQAGVPVEDLGIIPDNRYYLTREDLMHSNGGLILKASQLLAN